MMLLVPLLVGVPLVALVYLLSTSDPTQATPGRFVWHLAITGGALLSLFLVLPDAGLLIPLAGLVAGFGCLTTVLHGLALRAARRARLPPDDCGYA